MTARVTPTKAPGTARARWTRVAGWALIGVGVVVSWAWSAELGIAGEPVGAAIAGASTMLLFSAGILVIGRASPRRGRIATRAFRIGALAAALGAIAAGVIPVAVVGATTGTVTADVVSGRTGDDYRVSGTAVVSSDTYHQTNIEITVRATDRTAPYLAATVSFADGTSPVTCTNTRQTWIHELATVGLHCESFLPRTTLDAISGITLSEP
ncbi:hypothetical protein IT072_20375 [Leifsonia sp. ZF2019]|uniref:hypothetical protein n=1 Tax=Leifsonia sp. ZF2019 TaxID=2781978 RepID=UPI001CC0CFDF|nr:hypothetical protein [Leifsonia sp. ZF2019]UAJ79503.1 hypothetical protein IT072_20375 [Leifsonia sp. ZF2019]